MIPHHFPRLLAALFLFACTQGAIAREWKFIGIPEPHEAEFVGMQNDAVVLRGPNGKSFEVPFARFSPEDQRYLRQLAAGITPTEPAKPGAPITSKTGYKTTNHTTLLNQVVQLNAPMQMNITGTDEDPIAGSTFLFTSPDAFLVLENVAPSVVADKFLKRMRVNGRTARLDRNIRVVQHAQGTIIFAHDTKFPAMTVYEEKNLSGKSMPLNTFVEYNDSGLKTMKGTISSFVLKRGYTATIAQNENGTGASRNYVAQDHDVVIDSLPKGLDNEVSFVRVFPWRWTGKKGIAGDIWKNLNVSWFYDWNIGAKSSLDLEYVAIRQKRWWPDLKQDWKEKGINHLLGYNEPDRPDQANMSVDDALHSWPDLLATGLRLGSPSTSDGGLGWLYDFMNKADSRGYRVDFVVVHYYRATADPGDAKGAADQFYRYLKGIHDRVKRPLWVKEWNNGANWTTAPDPNSRQQRAAIAAMIKMLDETPFVERYALYNWVEEVRHVESDGKLTPAGEVYRDQVSPLSYIQPKSQK